MSSHDEDVRTGSSAGRTSRHRRPRGGIALGAGVLLLGAALLVATFAAGLGHLAYLAALLLLAVGFVGLIALLVRGRILALVLATASVAMLGLAGALVVVDRGAATTGWEEPVGPLPGWPERVGDVVVAGGIGRDAETGVERWNVEDDQADIMMVSENVIVMGADDATIAVDPSTGDELWQVPGRGVGVAHDGETLVVEVRHGDADSSTRALDLSHGRTVWEDEGRPAMECRLGPVNLQMPAPEQRAVIIDGPETGTSLAAVSDGSTVLDDVGCVVMTRVTGDVLVEDTGTTELSGRSIDTGELMWTASASEPRHVQGGPAGLFDVGANEVREIDTATGEVLRHPLPDEVRSVAPVELQRTDVLWLSVETDDGTGVWSPGLEEVVLPPDAAHDRTSAIIGASSGWVALSGATRDLTGQETASCWAVAPEGTLHGPVDDDGGRARCQAIEGLLSTDDGNYPLEATAPPR